VSPLGWIAWSLGVAVLALGAPVARRLWRGEPTRLDRDPRYITRSDPEFDAWVRSMPSGWFAGIWLLLALALLTLPGHVARVAGLACAGLMIVFGLLSLSARLLGHPRCVIAPHLRDR
jgi:hypothetical protein